MKRPIWSFTFFFVALILAFDKCPTLVESFSPSLPAGLHQKAEFASSLLPSRRSNRALHAEDEDTQDMIPENLLEGPWVLANDFQMFLNQCALQSLLFLMNEVRDRQTALWLEEFAQPIIRRRTLVKRQDFILSDMAKAVEGATNSSASQEYKEIRLLYYHGLAAMNTTRFPSWESFFETLLKEPTETYVITSASRFVPDYELEINPASLCSRLVSVREQIAREFVKDLSVIEDLGGQTIASYWEKLKATKYDDEGIPVERPSMLFLDYTADMQSDYAPSPLRKGNFDLLMLISTQESIHRVLNDPSKRSNGSPDKASIHFLRSFYAQRIGSHFTGSQFYGRADDFLEELLKTPPSTVQLQDEETALVDPVRIVEMILKEREKVAIEWGDMAYDAPETHTAIKRWQLNRLMGIDTKVESSFE